MQFCEEFGPSNTFHIVIVFFIFIISCNKLYINKKSQKISIEYDVYFRHNSSRHTLYTRLYTTYMPVCAYTYRMLIVLLLPARKVFYYFIMERVCVSILRSRKREKWSIVVNGAMDLGSSCGKILRLILIHGIGRFIVHTVECN